MKNWWMPTIAIAVFFILLSVFFKMMPASNPELSENQAKVETAMKDLSSPVDTTDIKITKSTNGELAPKWGTLKAEKKAKIETLTFNGTKSKPVAAGAEKKDKKKKKKHSKKKNKVTVIVQKNKTSPKVEATEESDDDSGFGGGAGLSSPKKQKDPNALPETAEEWEDYVLNPPNVDRLMSFIKYRQANIISDIIYYTVCEKMILSKNNDVRKFGVIALGSTPALQSFILLSLAAENEDSDRLQTLITSQYPTYWALQYVNLLGTALKSDNQAVRYFAAISIGESASINIKPGSGTTGRGRTSKISSQSYISLIPVLQNLAARDPNDRVRSAATHSLDIIKSLTQSSTVAYR